MEKGLKLVVEFLDKCESTHLHLVNLLKSNAIKPPHAISTKIQTNGVGSRGNSWLGYEGNLFLSVCVDKNSIPNDLNDASISIYFSMILKQYLKSFGSNVWVKWPNDFYINDRKIGGILSTKINDNYIISLGLNLVESPDNADILDINLTADSIVWGFCEQIDKMISWKHIFSKFKIEFEKSKKFITHIDRYSVDLSQATLCEDGAIFINNKKVYSLR